MKRVFRIGLIGFGGFGKFLHHHWMQLDNIQIAAVADPAAQKLYGVGLGKTYSDWREMLDEKDIDLIAIATVPDTHESIAKACMEAGKHILIEKPLAISMEGAQDMIRTRDKTKTIASIDFIMRFNPLLQHIRSLTRQGVFGKLRRVAVENYAQDEQLPPEHWFWNSDQSGGILIEHAVHFIDLVHFLNPAPMLVANGLKFNRNKQQEDQMMANVLYADGLIATHYHSFARPGFFETTSIKLAYDLADIELQGWIPLQGQVKALVSPHTKQVLQKSPFFELKEAISVEHTTDESRPAGWGDTSAQSYKKTVLSGGIAYQVSELISGRFHTGLRKQEVYAACVQASLLDVLRKIEDPDHELTAPLETGLSSLEIAVLSTQSARSMIQ